MRAPHHLPLHGDTGSCLSPPFLAWGMTPAYIWPGSSCSGAALPPASVPDYCFLSAPRRAPSCQSSPHWPPCLCSGPSILPGSQTIGSSLLTGSPSPVSLLHPVTHLLTHLTALLLGLQPPKGSLVPSGYNLNSVVGPHLSPLSLPSVPPSILACPASGLWLRLPWSLRFLCLGPAQVWPHAAGTWVLCAPHSSLSFVRMGQRV